MKIVYRDVVIDNIESVEDAIDLARRLDGGVTKSTKTKTEVKDTSTKRKYKKRSAKKRAYTAIKPMKRWKPEQELFLLKNIEKSVKDLAKMSELSDRTYAAINARRHAYMHNNLNKLSFEAIMLAKEEGLLVEDKFVFTK